MTELNPYAPPAARASALAAPARPGLDFMRDDDRLVVRKDTVLPAICIVNGTPVVGALVHRKVHWVPQWIILVFVLVSPIIGALVVLFVRKKAEFTFGLGEAARAKRRRGILVGVATMGGSGLAIAATAVATDPSWMVVGLVGVVVGIVVAAAVGQPFRVTKIDNDFIYLKLRPAALAAFDAIGASTLRVAASPASSDAQPDDDAYRRKLHADLEREF